MFGINPSEFIVLLAVAAVVLGPERLPEYAQSLARLVRELRRMARGASVQVRQELGPEFDDIDWRKLDPRQYDPRRIVREALADTFDPEDPLGLKDWDDDIRRRRNDDADDDDDRDEYDDEPRAEKPQSPGGPSEYSPSADGVSDDGVAEPVSKRPAPAFDPDVT